MIIYTVCIGDERFVFEGNGNTATHFAEIAANYRCRRLPVEIIIEVKEDDKQ